MALTAEHSPAAGTPPARAGAQRAWLSGNRLYLVLTGVALAIAALSLLIPSTPSYDPWAWLIWGREIVHLELHTTGGPSWKPLPVVFTTLFAPFGKAAPDLWLVVARTGALMSVAMCAKLAWRLTRMLTPGDGVAPALLAAVIGAGSLVVGAGFISDNALGYSEGVMTALVLIAVERHMDGKPRQAFAYGLGAALDRPEVWALWGLYGLWLFWRDPGARTLVVGLFALIPLLWFAPEYWGSGHFFRGVARAQHVRSNSAANASFPFWAELTGHAWRHVLLRVKVPLAIAFAVAAAIVWRGRSALLAGRQPGRGWPSDRLHGALGVLVTGGLGAGWWILIALMTQAGFSGNDRYLILGAGLISVAGGVAWGWGAHGLGALAGRLLGRRDGGSATPAAPGAPATRPAVLAGAGTLAAAVLFMALPPWIGANVVDVPATHRALVYQAKLRTGMAGAVQRAGGATAILRCGSVMTEGFQVPMLAWHLDVHTVRVTATPLTGEPLGPPPNTIFQARAQRKATLLPTPAMVASWRSAGADYAVVAQTSTFRVFSTCHR